MTYNAFPILATHQKNNILIYYRRFFYENEMLPNIYVPTFLILVSGTFRICDSEKGQPFLMNDLKKSALSQIVCIF